MTPSPIRRSAIFAIAMVALALTLAWAGKAGALGADAPTRSSMIITGLILAYYGNDIPKTVLRSASALVTRRVAGWSFALAGLTDAAVWAFASQNMAFLVSVIVTGLAILVTFGACLLRPRRSAA